MSTSIDITIRQRLASPVATDIGTERNTDATCGPLPTLRARLA